MKKTIDYSIFAEYLCVLGGIGERRCADIVEKENKLTNKERLFCRFYSVTRSAGESALRAGYDTFPEVKGLCLLTKSRIRECIREFDEIRADCGDGVRSGLERVAFGEVNDAVKLLFKNEEISEEELSKLDLFCVSEIKKPKGGGMEIKFFDRLKALEKLGEMGERSDRNISPFFRAVEEGAKRLYSKGE